LGDEMSESGEFTGLRALVCGASAGIGLATAKLLAQRGAQVYLLARNESSLRVALNELDHSERHRIVCADMTVPESAVSAITSLKERPTFHVLINNTAGPPPGAISQASSDQFTGCFQQHVLCAHALTQHLLPGMLAAKFGRIVNVISTSVKEPIQGLGVSNTIRAAMASWAKTLAGEVAADGITVNNVLPGYTKTQRLQAIIEKKSQSTGMTAEQVLQSMLGEVPMRRAADPSEIASAIVFLCSRSAGYITGINLPVDGGRTKSL
jgi:3-oxoacyl-[acyl-carrier protein] reductase